MSQSWEQIAQSCKIKNEVATRAIAFLEANDLHEPADSVGLTAVDVDGVVASQNQFAVKAAVRNMIQAANSQSQPQVSTPVVHPRSVEASEPIMAKAFTASTSAGRACEVDSFFQVGSSSAAHRQSADPPTIRYAPIQNSSSFTWIQQVDLLEWLHTKLVSLRSDHVFINHDELLAAIQRTPAGLSTMIEWGSGRVRLLTQQQPSGQWQTAFKKFSLTVMVTELRHTNSRSERWSNISNLSGWLTRQAEKIRRHDPDYTADDVKYLEQQILGSPMGLVTTIEWTTGTWHLKIKQSGDIWEAISVMEEKTMAVVASVPFHTSWNPVDGTSIAQQSQPMACVSESMSAAQQSRPAPATTTAHHSRLSNHTSQMPSMSAGASGASQMHTSQGHTSQTQPMSAAQQSQFVTVRA